MAGSYRHVTNSDGSFRGVDLLDGMRDAAPAIEEMHAMIEWMAKRIEPGDPRRAIWKAHNHGYLFPRYPWNKGLDTASFRSFWSDD